jgi:hypothetical protein
VVIIVAVVVVIAAVRVKATTRAAVVSLGFQAVVR